MSILNYFFGSNCVVCGKESEDKICLDCFNKIKFFPKDFYFERKDFYFKKIYPLFPYNNIVSQLIHKYKFDDYRSISKLFSTWLNQYFYEIIDSYDYILPVPIHIKKEKARGFNQTELILKEGGWSGKLFVDIKKNISTKQQSLMISDVGRKKNIENVFEISESGVELVKNNSFLIFDDVTTTGTTANEIAKHLYFCGASKIDLMVLSLA